MSRQKIALVTGANRGIGAAIAYGLEKRGCLVYRGTRRESVSENPLNVDVSCTSSILAAKSEFSRKHGCLDILINNAAVHAEADSELRVLTEEAFRETLETNLLGAFRVTNGLLACLKRSPSARVINVSSRLGQLSTMTEAKLPAYSISKAALNALTVQQSLAYNRFGISVNCMCPGWVRTDMGGEEAPLTPEEGAETAVWLALDAPHKQTAQFWANKQAQAW